MSASDVVLYAAGYFLCIFEWTIWESQEELKVGTRDAGGFSGMRKNENTKAEAGKYSGKGQWGFRG